MVSPIGGVIEVADQILLTDDRPFQRLEAQDRYFGNACMHVQILASAVAPWTSATYHHDSDHSWDWDFLALFVPC